MRSSHTQLIHHEVKSALNTGLAGMDCMDSVSVSFVYATEIVESFAIAVSNICNKVTGTELISLTSLIP